MVIHLAFMSPWKSSNLPNPQTTRAMSWILFDFAPNGVCKHLNFRCDLVVSYTTFSPLPKIWRYTFCGTFHFLLTKTLPIKKHFALRCPDFPLLGHRMQSKSNHPTGSNNFNSSIIFRCIKNDHIHHTCAL